MHWQVGSVDVGASLVERDNMLFAGTSIVHGACRALVTHTAMRTEIGYDTTPASCKSSNLETSALPQSRIGAGQRRFSLA